MFATPPGLFLPAQRYSDRGPSSRHALERADRSRPAISDSLLLQSTTVCDRGSPAPLLVDRDTCDTAIRGHSSFPHRRTQQAQGEPWKVEVPESCTSEDLEWASKRLLGEPARVPMAAKFEERLTQDLADAIRILGVLGGRSQEVMKEQQGEPTQETSVDITEDECGAGAGMSGGELTVEHRSELAWLSKRLEEAGVDGLVELIVLTLDRLDFMRAQGTGARREVNKALIPVQNVIVLLCCRGLTLEELGHQGLPAVLKARLAHPLRRTLSDNIASRLGAAKYWLFCGPKKFSRRYRKRKDRAGASPGGDLPDVSR